MTPLAILGDQGIFLFYEATAVEPTEFLTTAMALKDGFSVMPPQVRQMDRSISSTSKGKAYSVCLLRTSFKLRSECHLTLYRMVLLCLPRESSEGIVFVSQKIKY